MDDEPPALDEPSYLMSDLGGVDIVGTAQSASQALEQIAVLSRRRPWVRVPSAPRKKKGLRSNDLKPFFFLWAKEKWPQKFAQAFRWKLC